MAFVTDKTLFIHVQKTGGMTVREILYRCNPVGHESGDAEGERHFGLPELRARHPGIESGRTSFGFVRHPVDWLTSRWMFAVKSGYPVHVRHRGSAAAVWMASCWSDRFDIFIEQYLERYPGIATQTMFQKLGLWSDKPVDRICQTERLFSDTFAVLVDSGENWGDLPPTKPRNASGMAKPTMPPDLRRRIMGAERALCDRFGYE